MSPSRSFGLLGWGVLVLSLVLLLASAFTFDRDRWPGLVGDEATYIMAAQSLAFDGDYTYSKVDYERFSDSVGRVPDGLILQSPDGGKTLLFGKPLFYPLSLAPFVRLAPVRGPAIANAVLLSLAALLSAWSLRDRFGAAAPWVMGSLVFGSALFAHTFWAHSDLFLGCLVAVAYAFAFRDPARGTGTASLIVAAALLATVIVSRPFYAPLALPVALLAHRRSRRGLGVFAIGLTLTLGLHLATNQSLRGSWSSYSGERQGFYSYTGFPEVSEGLSWQRSVGERGSNSWTATPLPFGYESVQTAWNVIYVVLGRHTGLVPYFFPLLLVLWGVRWDSRNVTILLGFAAVTAAFLLVRPYNYYGGGGALANRYLVPAIPALWFLGGTFSRWRLLWVALGAALFMAPLWAAPRGYLLNDDKSYRYVAPAAQLLLPYETTQSHLKPSGREDFVHAGLWIKPLSRRAAAFPENASNAQAIRVLPGAGRARVLVGSREPLEEIRISIGDVWLAVPPQLRAHHRMWWSEDPIYLYAVDLGRALSQPELLEQESRKLERENLLRLEARRSE